MKLVKHTSITGHDGEKFYTKTVEATSNNSHELKSKAHDLCALMGIEPSPWSSIYPLMGNDEKKPDQEYFMKLHNGVGFTIEK